MRCFALAISAALMALSACTPALAPTTTDQSNSPSAVSTAAFAPEARSTVGPTLRAAPEASLVPHSTHKIQTTPDPTAPPSSDLGLLELVRRAKEDLARRLGTDIERIELIEIQVVVWPDGSLGCPDPEMAYPQVMQEGALIRLRSGKNVYEYHSGSDLAPNLCMHPGRDSLLPPPGFPDQ